MSLEDQYMWLVLGLVVIIIATAFVVAYSRRKDTAKIKRLEGELDDMAESIESMKLRLGKALATKSNTYQERNYIVTLMCRVLIDNGLANTLLPDCWRIWKGWTPEFTGWEGVVYVQPPKSSGLLQMSWHYSEKDKWMLESLNLEDGPPWDGRDAKQKYENIEQHLRQHLVSR